MDRPEPGNISVKAARLQSLVEILPDGSPTTTTIATAARRLRARPEWHGPAGQRLNLYYIEKAVGKLVEANPDLVRSKFKVSHRGLSELRIWRRQLGPDSPSDGAVP
jgi:hypothetical protein